MKNEILLVVYAFLLLLGATALAAPTSEIQVPPNLQARLKSFEPSAVLYLEDLKYFLVASDDTDAGHSPFLFLMNKEGAVDRSPLVIEGVEELSDMESLSQDGNFLYILASQSLNKKGREKFARDLFVRARRSGRRILAEDSLELRPLLLQAIRRSTAPELQSLRGSLEEELDIESHFVRNGKLYLGLKGPQPALGKALILGLGPVSGIFERRAIDPAVLSVWRTIDFQAISRSVDLLSDIQLSGDRLLISTTMHSEGGKLWSYDIPSGRLSLLRMFTRERPEGVSFDSAEKKLTVVFDQGSDTGLFLHTPL